MRFWLIDRMVWGLRTPFGTTVTRNRIKVDLLNDIFTWNIFNSRDGVHHTVEFFHEQVQHIGTRKGLWRVMSPEAFQIAECCVQRWEREMLSHGSLQFANRWRICPISLLP